MVTTKTSKRLGSVKVEQKIPGALKKLSTNSGPGKMELLLAYNGMFLNLRKARAGQDQIYTRMTQRNRE